MNVARAADVLDVSPASRPPATGVGAVAGGSWAELGDRSGRRRSSPSQWCRWPWSASSAWAVFELAAGHEPQLSPVERARARRRLVGSRSRWARRATPPARADRRRCMRHPSVLGRVVGDGRVVRGGVSAALITGRLDRAGRRRGLRPRRRGGDLVDRYALDEDADRPNVILHVVDDEVWPFGDQQQVVSWPVAAVDLLDADDERSRRAGLELIDRHQ